jgi:hypothetical protein
MSIPKFLKGYGVALTLFGALLVAYVTGFISISSQISQQTSSLHSKIDGINKDLNAQIGKVETRATKLESAVKALGDNQVNPLKGLVHDLLAAATNALPKKPEVAARAINAADSLIVTLKKEKQPADAEYFQNMVSVINELSDRIPRAKSAGKGEAHKPNLIAAVYSTNVSLAEYRSALQPLKQIGLTINCASESAFAFGAAGDKTKADRYVSGLTVNHCSQILDGFSWTNVAFVDSHIIYRGGPVVLNNVFFVNCKFEVEINGSGFELLQYSTLDKRNLAIDSEKLFGVKPNT